jgi:threonylcarbamoyladenosine tRNA methylthiotransferase MtaB
MPKFFIYTFGCRCNQADSASMRAGLCSGSLQEARDHRDADLVVINTCTVTHRTDQQVRQTVRKLHRENPKARLVVTGCYAQRDPRALASLPGVNQVVGNAEKDRLVEILEATGPNDAGVILQAPLDAARDYLLAPMSQTGGRTRPFVKLQDGCDARCSYCIVPAVRGPGRSARPEDILAEVRALVDGGYQEIVLTGVHLGSYGRRLATPTGIVDLLKRILDIPGLGRLRLSSIEPMRFSRDLVRLAAENPVFAPHFHIPLQSGSDRILRLMRRPYTSARLLDLLEYIRASLPNAGLGTDVIAGFPGETVKDFGETEEFIRKSPLTYLHVFPFSAREGTDAFSLPERVSPRVIRDRARLLREMSQEKNLSFRCSFVGRTLPALTLAKEEGMGESVVLTENYIHARIPASTISPNRLVNVRIVDAQAGATFALPQSD